MLSDYSINGKKGKFVGWFGIVRKIEEDPKLNQTNLLLEHKLPTSITRSGLVHESHRLKKLPQRRRDAEKISWDERESTKT